MVDEVDFDAPTRAPFLSMHLRSSFDGLASVASQPAQTSQGRVGNPCRPSQPQCTTSVSIYHRRTSVLQRTYLTFCPRIYSQYRDG